MFLRRTFFLVLSLVTAILGQEEQATSNGNQPLASQIVHEDFLPVENEADGQHFLRGRQLQTATYCPAFSPQPYYVCGMPAPIPGDTKCLYSSATCAGLTYGCSCNGVATQCNYCEIRMEGAIQCQLGGTTTTYSDTVEGLKTCQCIALGNGQVTQNCFKPTTNPYDEITQPPGSYLESLNQQQQTSSTSMPVSQPTTDPQFSLTAGSTNVKANDVVYPESVPVTYPVSQQATANPVVYYPVSQTVPANPVVNYQPVPQQGNGGNGQQEKNSKKRRR